MKMIVSFCCFRYQTKKIFRQVIKIFLSTKNFFFLFRKTSFSSYHFFISFYLGIIFFYWIKLHRKFAEAWQFFYFYSLELECILIFLFCYVTDGWLYFLLCPPLSIPLKFDTFCSTLARTKVSPPDKKCCQVLDVDRFFLFILI